MIEEDDAAEEDDNSEEEEEEEEELMAALEINEDAVDVAEAGARSPAER